MVGPGVIIHPFGPAMDMLSWTSMVLSCIIAVHLSSGSRVITGPTRCLYVQRSSGRERRGWHQRQTRGHRVGVKYAALQSLCVRLQS